jgi:hypothetical protein
MTRKLRRKIVPGLQFVAVLAVICCRVPLARADLEVSATVQIHAKAEFEAPLSTHGTWVEVGSHGRCWHPAGVAVQWRPYCTGEWVWTDCGWYWQTDEPWGWACYHYGYWVVDPVYGWIWVPGVEWAPAWVSWRVGGGYVGWAPLPPPGFFFAARPKPEVFVFVNSGHFADPVRPATVVVRNNVIFSKTAEVGGVKREARTATGSGSQRVMVNQGPKIEEVQKATGKTFQPVPIQEAARRTTMTASYKRGGNEPKGTSQGHSKETQATREPDHKDRDSITGTDRSAPPSGGPWQSGGSGGGHGHGGGGHGKERD